jgi:hypothetical protein
MPANGASAETESARQLQLFDGALAGPERPGAELSVAENGPSRSNAILESGTIEVAEPSEPADWGPHEGADRATIAALEAALADARAAADDRPALAVLASLLGEVRTSPATPQAGRLSLW